MNKRLVTMLAATAVLGVTTAFAANPFSDVTPDTWAYQSVSQLAAAGVINGYPDGTFKGQNNITRYEMAQMVAKAMANQSRANAEQQAMINRLADEFSAELNNLGVRVANLEKKVGNVKVTGDARLRYQKSKNEKSHFDYRGRIQFNATVNDNTRAVVRVSTGDVEFGDATSSSVEFENMYVEHDFGKNVTVKGGRFDEVIGNGLVYDDSFDGVKATVGNDRLTFEASHGYAVKGYPVEGFKADENISMTALQLKGNVNDNVALGGYYVLGNKNMKKHLTEDVDIYGFHGDANFGKVWVGGEWTKASKLEESAAWIAGVGYGNYDQAVKGTWDVKGQYFNFKKNAPIISTTYNIPVDMETLGGNNGLKGWMATADYALAKNVGLTANYIFSAKNQDNDKANDYYRVELNYNF